MRCDIRALLKYHVEAGNVESTSQTQAKKNNRARDCDCAGPAYLRGALRSLRSS